MSAKFDINKTYTYLKGVAMGLNFTDSVKALAFARDAHKDQKRKGGEPYIIHPLTVASHAVSLGMKEDSIISVSLLHDVVEDCGISVKELPVSDESKESVYLLTHQKNVPLELYYSNISTNRVASVVKLLDRCNNVSTMAGAFTREKIKSYIHETNEFVLPLLRTSKNNWPENSNQFFVLKYHIQSVIDGLEICLNAE